MLIFDSFIFDESILQKKSLKNLEINLERQGYDIDELPMVIQYNKRDLPNAIELSQMKAALNKFNSPDFEAQAHEGMGVFESFKTVSKSIVTVLKGGQI